MKNVAVSDEVRMSVPSWVRVDEVRLTRGGRGDPVVGALGDADITVAATAALAPAAPTRATTRSARAAEPTQVTVRVAPDERAILLVERDGVYEWVLPEAEHPDRATRGGGRGGAQLVFQVSPGTRADSPTRGLSLGSVATAVVHVLSFPSHLVGDLAVRYLERKVTPGLVNITGSSLDKWRKTERLPKLPSDRPARVLLLVHGTFSSTAGGFGGLTRIPDGKLLLERALEEYDAVIGYDHRTLSVDPFDNAQEFLDVLERFKAPLPMRIDAIAHSRGGLTLRSLIEHLLPARPDIGVVERALLAACTNGGTQLARPANWKALLDVYTNLAVAGATIGGTVVGPILAGALTGVSTLAKYLTTASLGDEKAIPGLAAMNPDGQFVATINAVQPGEPTEEEIVYDILTSDFEPAIGGSDPVATRLKKALTDAAIDRLMRGVENDGVVDVGGMRRIGPGEGYVDDELHFSPVEAVNHSGYFTNAQAVRRMAAWLGLLTEAGVPEATPAPRAAIGEATRTATAATPRRPATKKAKWTVMVYQAGFNSLNEFAAKDLREMQAAELDPSVRVSVFQCRNDAQGRRVAFQALVGGPGTLDERTELADVDSGHPGTVLDFARWTIERAPAERYALVLWSHGTGWEPEDFDELYTSVTGGALAKGAVRSGAAARRTLFLTSAVELVANPKTRAIIVDDGTGHSLDTLELGGVVKSIRTLIGAPLDLLGMDACLMNCVEVGHQLRNDVRAIVGSQEEEPGDGWPYTTILDDLSARPTMTGVEWGTAIADRYIESYVNDEQVTQSVLDLTKLRSLTRPVNALGRAVAATCVESNQNRTMVRMAVMDALSFPRNDGTQVDLGQLCVRLKDAGLGGPLDTACDAVLAALRPGGAVAACQCRGDEVAGASGISIYFPEGASRMSDEYARLAFARTGDWADALAAAYPTAPAGGRGR